jgi:importin subunit beta-1
VFGDIALAIGTGFKAYLGVVMGVLEQASQIQVDKADFDMIDYLNELRESCIEGYTGIVQGLGADSKHSSKSPPIAQTMLSILLLFR